MIERTDEAVAGELWVEAPVGVLQAPADAEDHERDREPVHEGGHENVRLGRRDAVWARNLAFLASLKIFMRRF